MSSEINLAGHPRLSTVVIFVIIITCISETADALSRLVPERKTSNNAIADSSSVLKLLPTEDMPSLSDDLDGSSLMSAIESSFLYFNRFRDEDVYHFGPLPSNVGKMKDTLIALRNIVALPASSHEKERRIRDTFNFYRSSGDDGKGHILFTGYYEPVLEGSFTRTGKYRYPVYRKPEETVAVNLGKFNAKYEKERLIGRVANGEVIPHYSRAEIDGKGALAGRNLEIIWVDDFVDLFFLHIQGSGKIRLPDGTLIQVGYSQSNGYPYRSIGSYLIDEGKLSRKDISMQGIKTFLRQNPLDAVSVLNYNERYVFFRFADGGPYGALDVPVTGGRSIASDHSFYPKGAPAFIRSRMPVIDGGKIASWKHFSRFVLNQDAGRAITGAGRIDLFCGGGYEAERVAGILKEPGELFFFIKK